MKPKTQSPLVVLHCLAAFALGSAALSGQDALVLDRPQPDASGNMHLSASVGTLTNVLFETSTNLTSWTPVASGTLASGILELIQPVESRARFYRLHRLDGGQAPLAVNVEVDALRRMSTVITSDGGEVSVSDATGTRYTLTMPTNAVLEPVIISMTVVTNLSGLPFSDSTPRGILLEPEGLQFSMPGRLTIEYSHQQPSTNATSFGLSGDGHELGLLPDQLISNRVELAVYHFSTYGVVNAVASEIQAQTQQTVPASFDNLEQQFANELRPLRDSGRLPLPGTPPPEPIGSRLQKLLDDFIGQHFDLEFLAGLSACGGALRGMVQVAQTLALARAYGLDESGLLPFSSTICAGLAKCAEEDIAQCKGGDAEAYSYAVRRETYARALGFSCNQTPADQFTNCLPKYYGTLKMLLHEKKLDSHDSPDVQTLTSVRGTPPSTVGRSRSPRVLCSRLFQTLI